MDEFVITFTSGKVDVFLNKNLVSSNTINPSIINTKQLSSKYDDITIGENNGINGGIKKI